MKIAAVNESSAQLSILRGKLFLCVAIIYSWGQYETEYKLLLHEAYFIVK